MWGPQCNIPDVEPFHPSIRPFLRPAAPIVCTHKKPPSYTKRLNNGEYVLKLEHGTGARNCCYSTVTRFNLPNEDNYTKDSDYLFNISNCKHIAKEAHLKQEDEFVLLSCRTGNKDAYANAHATVPIKDTVKDRLTKWRDPNRPSVLILGLDSISRLNLIRTMPVTVSLLRRTGWLELQGYNKVGDNTFPNVMAMLTGMSPELLRKHCWKNAETKLDECPIIWKEFQAKGYITAYAEDTPYMSTFNYHKTGFIKQPTDYYMRPFMVSANLLGKKQRDHLDICIGPMTTTHHVFSYTVDFATTFQNALYFALMWVNNFSHNNHNTPAAMDVQVSNLLQELMDTGVLNNTIVIFLSDHGIRFGKLRETVVGWLEERLPFIYFWIPQSFKDKYPESYSNIIINKNRLTTPYDLHFTLKDILERPGSTKYVEDNTTNTTYACSKCKSLFTEISKERSCEEASITEHWCTCTEYRDLLTSDNMLKAGVKFVLTEIQKKLDNFNAIQSEKLCADLRLKSIVKGRSKIHDLSKNSEIYDDYILVFITEPGDAMFEATVRHWKNESPQFKLMGSISRLNTYMFQSDCVHDSELKMFCICVESGA